MLLKFDDDECADTARIAEGDPLPPEGRGAIKKVDWLERLYRTLMGAFYLISNDQLYRWSGRTVADEVLSSRSIMVGILELLGWMARGYGKLEYA